jgi:TPR repeat protein
MDDSRFETNSNHDKVILSKCPNPNWGDILFNWLTPYFREKFFTSVENSFNKAFFYFVQGVRAEYSINCEENLPLALEYYSKAADMYESNALYKLYSIHSKESEKFAINRNKNLEIYYLLKAMAYSDCVIFFNNDTLYNIDIVYEIALILDLSDPQLEKTNKLFLDLKGTVKDENELRFVEALTLIKFNVNDDDVVMGLSVLQDLADNYNYVEAIYKLACIYSRSSEKYVKEKDPVMADKYFKLLVERKFYKAYNDYGYFLYYENRIDESMQILKEGSDNGNSRCIFLYYDIFLSKLDFSKESISELANLLKLLVIDIITGNAFSIFEFFYIRYILHTYFHFTVYENSEEDDFVSTELISLMSRIHTEKNFLENNFVKGIVETEFKLSFGFINYIGVNEHKDHDLAEKLLKEAYKISINPSYQRFCYSYIFKLRLKKAEHEGISKEKLDKTKVKVFKIYSEAMDKSNLDDFSSSYFYYLAKLYENGWGTKQNLLFAYCYYYHASIAKTKYLGTGSIISYFRKFKSKEKLGQEKFLKIAEEMEEYKKKSISSDPDDQLCIICYENVKDVMYYPCKHMSCERCFEKLKQSKKCPHCRGKIIMTK